MSDDFSGNNDYSEQITIGRYRHFKGAEYLVLGTVRHSETLEVLVLYQALYGDRGIWVRPIRMFLESVTRDGQVLPRFLFLE
jgi:hypothetical protein